MVVDEAEPLLDRWRENLPDSERVHRSDLNESNLTAYNQALEISADLLLRNKIPQN
jgi:hypothetical protein